MATIYQNLGVPTFINARGTITTLGGSLMPPPVVEAMAEAARYFVPLNEFNQKASARIAQLTGAEAAFVCAGAASGMLLSGAACLTGTDPEAIANLPDTGDRPNQFVISLVDSHYYIHQGFRLCGGQLTKVGSRQAVTPQDYADGITEATAAAVFFLGSQPIEQLPPLIAVAHAHQVPVIVDAAAQLPPRSNLTDLTAMGADLVVFSGGKGLFGPQASGLILGRADLIEACALNSNPHSGVGRGMKVGKEEIAGLLKAVELFMAQDEEAVIADWEKRCHTIAAAAEPVAGIEVKYHPPYSQKFPPASPLLQLNFSAAARLDAPAVLAALADGSPSILASGSDHSLTFGPQTLQAGEAELIAARLREILAPGPSPKPQEKKMATEDKTVLSTDQVDQLLPTLEGWQRTGIVISRDFVLANFKDITDFLNHLVKTITAMNHHPDFSLDTGSKTVAVAVTTHSEQAVTQADINFARALNAWRPGA